MYHKKYFISLLTAIVSLFLCGETVLAVSSSDLLKMDVQRPPANDPADVTFYTTSGTGNTVVTRKDNNRYVVLLPNTSSSSSITPNISALKDLVTDVNVKHIDDGIGGYTKVTFSTTKPLKIQTFTQKTAPLTKAQQEYKNLIEQNSKTKTEKKADNVKSVANIPVSDNIKSKSAVSSAKTVPAVSKVSQVVNSTIKPKQAKQTIPTTTPKKELQKELIPKVASTLQNTAVKDLPKQKKLKNDDLAPKISHNIETGYVVQHLNPDVTNEDSKKDELSTPQKDEEILKQEENVLPSSHNYQYKFPILPLVCLFGIMLFAVFVNLIGKIFVKHSKKIKDLFEVKEIQPKSENKREFEDIMYDNKLSWQEKFKHYNENNVEQEDMSDYTFVTNGEANKSVIIENSDNGNKLRTQKFTNNDKRSKHKSSNILKKISKMDKDTSKNILSIDNPEARYRLQEKIEHVFSGNTLNANGLKSKPEVESEDNVITDTMSHIKLRSFAKNKNLLQTNRGILKSDKNLSQPLQEKRFVKLRNSALSMNNRSVLSNSYGFSITDLIKTGSKYLNNNEVESMDSLNESYSQASLEEYFSMLDNDVSEQITPNRATKSVFGVSNPIAHSRIQEPKTSELDGLVVQTGYNIDEEKGFYLVNMDGITALVGKINDSIFILKKFDKIINQPLQVRLDYGSVYIVRVGGFKCLVDVSKDKMGTLLEI